MTKIIFLFVLTQLIVSAVIATAYVLDDYLVMFITEGLFILNLAAFSLIYNDNKNEE